MDFTYTEEQRALQDSLGRFITKDYGFEQRRALARSETGFSAEAWGQYAEFGLLALPFPEELGGLGGSPVDVMLVMEQFGRGLVLEPYLATVVLAGGLLRDVEQCSQREALLEGIATGELKMALAHHEPGTRYELKHVKTIASAIGDGWEITGHKAVVLSGDCADKLLVSARTSGEARDAAGISLFLVDADASGLTRRGYVTQDGGRAAEINLDKVQVAADALVGTVGAALPFIERAFDCATAALCAEAVGIMEAVNQATLEYLKTRKQFGVPIGKFQALQHRMADMVVATEQARSMAMLAAVKVASDDPVERARAVSGAKTYVGQSLRFVGQQAVQLHGGMGVTDELNVGHYFKRLTTIGFTFGDADYHLARYCSLMTDS